MLRHTQLAAIAIAASFILSGSQADAQGINIGNQKNSRHTVTFSRSNSSANRGFTINNSAPKTQNRQRQNQGRFGNFLDRQRGISLNQSDQQNRFGLFGRSSAFVNPSVSPQSQAVAFVPQVPTPAPRPRPRLIPNEFIVGLAGGSRFANASSAKKAETEDAQTEDDQTEDDQTEDDQTETEASRGPIENPFYSVLVTDDE